jgi:CSLREA domain-containing protein
VRLRLLGLLPVAAAFAVLAFPSTALAGPNTIVVTTAADDDTAQATDCTLRDAIASADTDSPVGGCSAGVAGADTIQVPAGTYFLDNGQLLINSDVDIVGTGARLTLISGSNVGQRDIEISPGDVTISGVTIENGSTTLNGNDPNHGVGGGVWVDSGASLTLQDSTVTDNHADRSGGGIDSDGSLTVVRSTIENNQAGCGGIACGTLGIGGGIDDFGASLSVTNSTITGNQAQGDGGGLYLASGATLTNDTIANNDADITDTGSLGGGGITVDGTVDPHTISLTNTLLAANPWHGEDANCSTGIASLGGNLADDTSCDLTANEQQGIDPKLGPIDSSGQTDVLPLTAGSPAIDTGNPLACPATDQRGVSRPQGAGCDIGAYELVQPKEAIAFESNRTGNSQIWTMNPDGSNPVQLTHDPSTATDSLPSISPDGHTVVYQSTVGGVTQIWAINGDGSNPRQLTTQGSNSQPTFSPDGTKIAFDSTRTGASQLFVMNADGSGQTQVMTIAGNVGGSGWSPDGSHIAFSDDSTGSNQIYTVDVASGTVSAPLTTDGANRNPHWSPDGSQILFVSSRCTTQSPLCGGGESVFLMNADGTNQHNLTSAPIFDADPAWSPNGTKIAFVRDLSGQNFNVFTANADGTNKVQLTFGSAPSRNSFPNWGTQVSGGVLAGSLSPNEAQSANLTALGTDDWAVWGFGNNGTSTSLAPDVRKAGGSSISDLTDVDPTGVPLRGLGQFAGELPFSFDWSDGSGPGSATAAAAGLQNNGLGIATTNGDGFSFTVPADTSERTVTVFTSEHWGTGTLTAKLSDGSAPPYTATVDSPFGDANFGGNEPGVFTIRYAAASAGQNLMVSWVESADNCATDGHCDNAAIYAVALSSALSNLTVDATSSSAGAGIDQVPINTIPNAWLSFFAGSTNSSPVGSTPVGSTPVGSTPVGSTPVGSTPVGSTPVGSTPVGSTPVGSTPVGSTGLFNLPVGSTPVGSTALSSVLLSQIQLHDATWDQVLCGSLLNKPLNAITLEDVKDSTELCSDNKTSLDHLEALTMNQVDFGTTLLRTVHWATLLAGNTELSALPGGFDAWCGANGLIPEDGGSCSNATGDTTVLQMDVAGQLGTAPVGSTPVGSTPVGSTPVGSTPVGSTHLGASLLANIPLSDIAADDHDLDSVVDCTKVNCSTGTLGDAQTANAILPNVTFSAIKNAMAANNITINDLVVAIIGAAGFPWETLPIQGLQPYSATPSQVAYTISDNVDCSLATNEVITARLPSGFFPVNGTAQFSVGNSPAQPAGDPTVLGDIQKNNQYRWTLDCPAGDTSLEAVTLKFNAWVGLTLGTFTTHATAAAGSDSISATGAPVTVHQNPEASDPSTATEIKPDTLVAGHIAFSGEQAFYKVKLTDSQGNPLPTGTKISAFLNVPSGADLDLTMSAPAAPSFFTTPVGSTPVGSTPIEDSAIGFQGAGTALPPDTLDDVPVGSTPVGSTPVGSTPVGSTSANREPGVNEDAGIITAGQSGYVTIGVSGYNGASSNKPFVLRVQETPPPPLPHCSARTLGISSANQGTLPTSLPTSTKTLFIVNKERLIATYGSTAVTPLLNSLTTLAARSEVAGSVLFVDGDPGVRNAYAAWDATPCDTNARNNVVRSINDVVASYRNSATGLPNLHYIVLVGSDEAGPPMADAPDPVLLSPEENEANDLAFTTNGLTQGNATYASAAQNNILTDGAYGAFTSIPWLGRNLLLPQISISRLVETPSDMVGQITRYLQSSGYTNTPQSGVGTLNPTSALVTGYDFLADGAQSVERNLKTNFGTSLSTALDTLPSGAPAINVPGSAWKPATAYRLGDIVHPTTANPSGLTFQAQNAGTSGGSEPIWPTSIVGFVPSDNGITWKAIAPWTAGDVLSAALTTASVPPSILALNAHYNQYELESASGDLANSGQSTAALAARILFTMGCHGGLNIPDSLGSPGTPNKYLDWPELYARDQVATYIANTGYGYGDSESVALSERLMSLFAKNLHSDSGSVGEEWVNALQQYFATAGAYDVYDEKVMEETTFYGLPFWHFSTAGSSPSFTPLTTTADPITGTQSATITFPGANTTTGTQFGLYRPNLPLTSQQVTSSLPARGVWIKNLTSNDTNANATIGYPTIDSTAHEPAPDVSPIFFPASPFTLEHSLAFGSERDYLNVSDQFRPTGVGDAGTQRHFGSGTFEIFYSQSADQVAPLISEVNVSDTGGVATVTARVGDDSGHVAEVAALVNDGTWHYLQLTQSTLDPTLWTGTIQVIQDPEVFVEATDGVNVSYSANKGQNFTSTNSNSPPSGVQILLQAPVGPYGQGQTVIATYQCGSAAAQCIGTVPNGSPIDTSTFGVHTFVVQALDADGVVIGSLERTYVVQYPFSGFFSPVDNEPVLNVVKAGSAIPVVFGLGGNQGLDIFASGYPKSQTIACDASAPADGIESTVTAGGSSLSYSTSTGRYTYVWKTDKSWTGTCRALIVKTKDGVTHRADFKFN